MEKKTVSAIMLTLLLTSMLTLAFNIQPVKAEPAEIIIDTEVGESRFLTYPDRVSPYYWVHVQNHGTFYTRAYAGNFWYTLCGAEGTGEPLYYGLWQASLPYSGRYQVFVWIPNPDPFEYDGRVYTPTQSAIYQIYHKDGVAYQTVNQRLKTGGWYSVGTFTFDATASVILNDRTGEPYLSTMIAFDAIKFVSINRPPYTPSNPSPSNHATSVSIYADLSWSGGDPDAGDTVTYDVYFGTSSSPPLVSNDQSSTTYDPGTLSYTTKYYWKIVATDNHGASTPGLVWDFTTGPPPPPPNHPPVASNLAISPSSPKTTDNLVGSYAYSDADGDPESGSEIRWYKDGVLQSAYNDKLTIPSSATAKGQVWYFTVKPKDGTDFGTLQTSPSVTIQNSPPTAPVVDVTPDSPSTTDNLVCTITSPSTDPDGDTITYTYEWYKDGVLQPAETTVTTALTDTVSSTLTAEDQVWKCVVTPNDGMVNGISDEDQVTIVPPTPPPNQPPYTPYNPSPLNHATAVSTYADLSWSGGDPDVGDTVTYDVYFGIITPPPLVSNDQSATTYDLGTLSYGTIYYWKIVATDNHGASTEGPIWDFTTQSAPPPPNNPPNTPSNPAPSNHATGVSIYSDLSWSGGDPDAGDTVTYDVYFGTTSSPPLVSNGQLADTYDPGTLNYSTKYYWKVVATDNHGSSSEGPVWDFTTESAPQVTAAIDELLLNLIDQHANSYFNPAWDITIDEYKAWIVTIAWGEGGSGGYVAHSHWAPGSDVFDHRIVGDKFKFSTGIGPFQIDNGGYDHWETWPTIKKLNPEETVKTVLKWHYLRFPTAHANLQNFSDNSAWYGVKYGKESALWDAVTGTSWNIHSNGDKVSLDWSSIKNQLSQNAQDLKFRYETNVKNMGVMRWSIKESDGIKTDTRKKVIFDGDYQTWLITAMDELGKETQQYYYTFDQSRGIEIWVWNNFQDPANKFRYIFVREYITGQFPEHRVSGVAGETLTSPAIVGDKVIANSPVDLIVTDPEGLTITKNASEVPGMIYNEFDLDGDGDLEDIVTILHRKLGNYSIWVVPEPEATPADTFTLVVSTQTETIVLAENVAIGEIPSEPYSFEYTSVLYTFSIVWGEETFIVSVGSNATVSNFAFSQPDKEVSFNVTGEVATIGFCNVTVPKALLYGEPWTVLIDGASVPPTITENATHTSLYFTYTHSTHTIQIIGTWAIGPPPDTNPPTIKTPFQQPEPDKVMPDQAVTVYVNVTDMESGVKNVILSYTTNGGATWTNLTMLYNATSMLYQATIPAFPSGTTICYKVIAYDNADNVAINDNAGQYYCYTINPPAPPPLSVSISPLSASILVGQSVTFTSTVSGGYTPYSYQWYLNGNPVSGATSASWSFTPTSNGIYYIYLRVTDNKGNTAQSDAARIAVATVPVGGYSFPIQVQAKTEPIIPYIALIATLTAIFTKLRQKTKRKRQKI
jgi:hypothetical protein